MLKHLNDTILAVLLHILNSCLQIQNIPAPYKHNLIYTISKNKSCTDCFNSVITNPSNTNLYQVYDVIDQRKTITPLLWRIYYNSLLSKNVNIHTRYIKQYKSNANLKALTGSYPLLAYIDH